VVRTDATPYPCPLEPGIVPPREEVIFTTLGVGPRAQPASTVPALPGLEIRPNPARGFAWVTFPQEGYGRLTAVNVASGITVATYGLNPFSRDFRLDVGDWPHGVYALAAEGPGRARLAGRLVVVR
jgi:hypothetical protein